MITHHITRRISAVIFFVVLALASVELRLAMPLALFRSLRLCALYGSLCSVLSLTRALHNHFLHRPVRQRAVLIASGILCSLVALEAAFLFVAKSHAAGFTFAAHNWYAAYWRPINRLGYRDYDREKIPADKKTLCVLGDSIAAGVGINDVRQRFSDLLSTHIGPRYAVLNLGKPGSDTPGELACLAAYPQVPDILILQYFPNDIEGAAAGCGLTSPDLTPYRDIPAIFKFFVTHSYLVNYLYGEFPHALGNNYAAFLSAAFTRPDIRAVHESHWRAVIDYCHDRGIALVVVLFPFMDDLDRSATFLSGLQQWLGEEHHVITLNMTAVARAIPPSQRRVNNIDPHPSARIHALAARHLYELLQRHNLINNAKENGGGE